MDGMRAESHGVSDTGLRLCGPCEPGAVCEWHSPALGHIVTLRQFCSQLSWPWALACERPWALNSAVSGSESAGTVSCATTMLRNEL